MDLYKETLASDPRLAVAAAQVEVSEARQRQSFANLLPQVSASAQWTDNKREAGTATDHYKGERYSVNVNQSVFDKARWENNSRYGYLSEQSELEYQDTRSGLAVDVLERYVAVLAAQDNLELIRAEREAISKQLEQLRSRYKRQLAVLTDVLDVEARLDGVRAQEIVARNDVSIARESLAELVGREVDEPLNSFAQKIDYAEDGRPLAHWIKVARSNNPSLLALSANIDAERASVREARAGHLPTVDMSLSALKSDIGFDNTNNPTSETYVAGLTVNVPLFSGGSTSARVDEAHALLVVAEKRREEQKRAVLKGVREAYLNTESSWARIAAAEKAVMSARKSYQAMQKGFKYGTVTVVDVLDALRDEYSFRRDYRQAQYDFAVSRMSLLQASGTLSQNDLLEVNGWLSVENSVN